MRLTLIALSIAGLGLAACHHKAPPPGSIQDYSAMEQFAIGAVYEARPTRALVDSVEIVPSDGANTVLRIEMTGAPTARNIYNVEVSETPDGAFELVQLDVLQ